MSSFRTHMLIGAVGGLALPRLLPLIGQTPPDGVVVEVGMVIASAVLATWPDVDEPGSWPARRVRALLTLVGGGLGAVVGLGQPQLPSWWLLAGGLGGVLAGALLGWLALRGLRIAAGGHRALTHSLIIGALLLLAAWGLNQGGYATWAILPVALAWGQALHVVGDVVTPAGVPLFAPIWTHDIRILPEPLCRGGEPLIAVVAMAVGAWLIWGGG